MSRASLRCAVMGAVPALLVALLLGCGKQQTPQEARNEQPPPAGGAPNNVAPQQPAPGGEPARPKDGEKINREITTQELLAKQNETITRDQQAVSGTSRSPGGDAKHQEEALKGLADPARPGTPAADSALMGGSERGKSDPNALPRFRFARGAEAKPEARPADARDGANKLAGDDRDKSTAEAYGSYRENEFRSPLVAALSTFSADVNTASYSNVRRMLTDGTLPVRDAVFVAEFVNYFPYKYATPKGDDPVEFNLETGPCPWNRKHHLVRVGVQAYQIPADKMPPRNLVFLVDTSGSMSPPNRLPLVRQALNLLVDRLGEKDRVSVVTYAGDSRVALGPTAGNEKDRIKEVITNLNANGSTNGEGGIRNAYRLARETFIDGGVNRVILCTDGDFNVGVTDRGELVRLIEEQRKSKVFLTILGFGMGNYKDETLKELANHGNGHHAYVDTLDEAKKLFVDQGGALVCVAKDVKFQVDFNPAKVAAYRLIGYENRLLKDEDFRNDAKDAGDMGSGHQVTVLYEIIPTGVRVEMPGVEKSKYTLPAKPDPNAPDEWLTVRMRYKHPEADASKELSRPLPGPALGKELSDDFRFAAAAAAFGMVLRDSEYRGGMTFAGVLEEAQGCVKDDPGGHRKEFLELVKRARDLAAPRATGPAGGIGAADRNGGVPDGPTLRKLADSWSGRGPGDRARITAEVLSSVPEKYKPMIEEYFRALEKANSSR